MSTKPFGPIGGFLIRRYHYFSLKIFSLWKKLKQCFGRKYYRVDLAPALDEPEFLLQFLGPIISWNNQKSSNHMRSKISYFTVFFERLNSNFCLFVCFCNNSQYVSWFISIFYFQLSIRLMHLASHYKILPAIRMILQIVFVVILAFSFRRFIFFFCQ